LVINIFDVNINYIVEGEGDTVLLLHGWGSNLTLFNGIIKNLSKTRKVYALDFPGFGDSEEPKESWNTDKYTEMVIRFVEQNKITTLSLLGHSFGGRIIIKMANKKDLSFKIDKIILVDSAGIIPEKKNNKPSFKTRTYRMLKSIVSVKLMKKIFPNAVEGIKKHFGSADYRSATPVMRDTLVQTVNENLEPLLSKILQPTLIIWGENDQETPIADAIKMEKLIQDSGIVKIPNAGHYSFLDNPILVNSVLNEFLK